MEKSEMLKSLQSAKTKLMAAISMLLVSAILFTNVSYAWFVLSTAPEVSGVSNTSGANGALEIALQSTDSSTGTAQRAEITNKVGDSSSLTGTTAAAANVTWGNIVDISTGYGLEDITLYPARLNVTNGTSSSTLNRSNYLKVPTYGTDGRISGFEATDRVFYDGTTYQTGENYGVNVHGFADGMDDTEQIIVSRYRREVVRQEAVEQVSSRWSSLRDDLKKAIEDNGHGLLTMMFTAVANLMDQGRDWSLEEKKAISALIDQFDIIVTETETALRWALLANVMADTEKYDPDVDADMTALGEIYGSFLSMDLSSTDPDAMTIQSIAEDNRYEELAGAVTTLKGIRSMLDDAHEAMQPTDPSDPWSGNYAEVGMSIVKNGHVFLMCGGDDPQSFIDGYIKNLNDERYEDDLYFVGAENITSAGFFPAMASILGDYSADMTGYFSLDTFVATKEEQENSVKMTYHSKSTALYSYSVIDTINSYDETKNKGVLWNVYEEADSVQDVEGNIPLYTRRGDVTAYGYSVDLAFRSSVSGDLVLQQEATSRVSDDSTLEASTDSLTANPAGNTMGGGSTMSFEIYGDMTSEQIGRLLESVYIVFSDSESGKIYAVGRASSEDVEVVVSDVTAPITVYGLNYSAMNDAEEGMLILGDPVTDNVITSLTADTPKYITATVYLNGDTVSSGDVSHQGEMSLIGSINFQFALNDVELESMAYDNYYVASAE